MAAGLAAMRLLDRAAFDRLDELGSKVRDGLSFRYLLDHGVLLSTTGLGCLPTPIGHAEIEGFLETFAAALDMERRAAPAS